VPFFWSGPGVGVGVSSGAHVSTVDIAPTVLEAAGIDPGPLGMDGRVVDLATGESGRKRLLVTGSDDVGPEQNPDGANNPTGRWWLLAEDTKRFILRENGARELYRMGADPFQNRSHHEKADPALIRRLTETVEAMRAARGEKRRRLEGAP
jgi:arylsulfatase A-like enzyme